mmetsp:Transcript_45165/g.84535  ORF Transcript_45165/g.84535 Transcript_45165/m.84535 type:complete len:202 (-) Transcript_45165:1428-2033(-)
MVRPRASTAAGRLPIQDTLFNASPSSAAILVTSSLALRAAVVSFTSPDEDKVFEADCETAGTPPAARAALVRTFCDSIFKRRSSSNVSLRTSNAGEAIISLTDVGLPSSTILACGTSATLGAVIFALCASYCIRNSSAMAALAVLASSLANLATLASSVARAGPAACEGGTTASRALGVAIFAFCVSHFKRNSSAIVFSFT